MKLEIALVFLMLLGTCLQVSVCQDANATISLTPSTNHVWPGVEFAITCAIGNYDSLGTEDYSVTLSVNYQRTKPDLFKQFAQFVVTFGNQSAFYPAGSTDLQVYNPIANLTEHSFQVTIDPRNHNANGYYQCRVRNYTSGYSQADLVEPFVWEPEFSLIGAANPVVPTVSVTMEVSQVADSKDLQLAKCVTNVEPQYINYRVYFVANYSMVDRQVTFGYYAVDYDAKTITWYPSTGSTAQPTDQLNFYPQNNTDFYPTFNALIQTSKSLSSIKSQLMCYVRLDTGPQFFSIYSSSGSFALAPSAVALVMLALVKLFN